jgi:hypothetical protein
MPTNRIRGSGGSVLVALKHFMVYVYKRTWTQAPRATEVALSSLLFQTSQQRAVRAPRR